MTKLLTIALSICSVGAVYAQEQAYGCLFMEGLPEGEQIVFFCETNPELEVSACYELQDGQTEPTEEAEPKARYPRSIITVRLEANTGLCPPFPASGDDVDTPRF